MWLATRRCCEEGKVLAWVETAKGIALPPPLLGSGNISISTLVDGGRNGNGNFIGQVVGDDKLKLEMSFPALSPAEFIGL